VNQEESEHNEIDGMKKGADSTGEVIHMVMYVWHYLIFVVVGTVSSVCHLQLLSARNSDFDVPRSRRKINDRASVVLQLACGTSCQQ